MLCKFSVNIHYSITDKPLEKGTSIFDDNGNPLGKIVSCQKYTNEDESFSMIYDVLSDEKTPISPIS